MINQVSLIGNEGRPYFMCRIDFRTRIILQLHANSGMDHAFLGDDIGFFNIEAFEQYHLDRLSEYHKNLDSSQS